MSRKSNRRLTQKSNKPKSARQLRRDSERQARKSTKKTDKLDPRSLLDNKFINKAKASVAQAKYDIGRMFNSPAGDVIEKKYLDERRNRILDLKIKSLSEEENRIFWGKTKQAWQGSATPADRYQNIIDAYSDIIESEYNGNVKNWLNDIVRSEKDTRNAAYRRDLETLSGKGWTDDELEMLSQAHTDEEVYNLLKSMGYYG